MIRKFSFIKNLAIFKDFEWDNYVIDENGRAINFSEFNVIYGRNYSGKTTLSRILRGIETGIFSDKYINPEFEVEFDNGSKITLDNMDSNNNIIRVFNKDFIEENLSFIINPESGIKSFSVGLGEKNKVITQRINLLEEKLGFYDDINCTGLYKDYRDLTYEYNDQLKVVKDGNKELEDLLKKKATGKGNGIKYKSDIYGDQNYNITKLKRDMSIISSVKDEKLNENEIDKLKSQIREERKTDIPHFQRPLLLIDVFWEKAKQMVEKEIIVSEKINALIKDIVLNEWVKKGYELHHHDMNVCSFCGNIISDERWNILDKHFDEETKKLEESISKLIDEIEQHKSKLHLDIQKDENLFYINFKNDFNRIASEYSEFMNYYVASIDFLLVKLKERYKNITMQFKLEENKCNLENAELIFEMYENLIEKSNSYSSTLMNSQKSAQDKLRLNEVREFVELISYEKMIKKNQIEEEKLGAISKRYEVKQTEIENILLDIKELRLELVDEEQGAKKVNEYLEQYFENTYLSLHAREKETDTDKIVEFEVWRENEKAYNLSEGECSLIAFCYYMASLLDTRTLGHKPIIWIDDPISSLDGNHIFCVYSIIAAELLEKDNFEQIFVSTHNLDFLRYLKRINGKFLNVRSEDGLDKKYFIINRRDDQSFIEPMPSYMKEYVTEFNYLFHQIYKCASVDVIDDSNFRLFYNFGNNARKFLELYLFYKYPCFEKDRVKMEKFFGEGKVPVMLVERVNNEYSHMKACFERGQMTIDVPEMHIVAKRIIKKLQEDESQFSAFLRSIGEVS